MKQRLLARTAVFSVLAACAFSEPALAQWLNYRVSGIPRTADGSPDLSAPAPRSSDGTPDLSGIWSGGFNDRYVANIAADLKPGEVQPWAEALWQERILNFSKDSPRSLCLPNPPLPYLTAPFRIVQTPQLVVLISEGGGSDSITRTIFADGRRLPKDPDPTWLGYSVGRWEGDTLVVDTAGFNDRNWLDVYGHPQTEALHITERFRRIDFGHLQIEMTFNDPTVFTRPFSITISKVALPDSVLLESVCEKNERILSHVVGGTGVRLPRTLLSTYAGIYELAPGREIPISARGDLLFMQLDARRGEAPLVPRSENHFESRAGGTVVEFVKDATGGVTHLVLREAGGEQRARRTGDLIQSDKR
jgi:hypothetical protein